MTADEVERLEGLFRNRTLSRRQFVTGLAALGLTGGAIEMLTGTAPLPTEAQIAIPQYLVVIVLDAFRPDYRSLAPMPTLDALERAGTSFDRAWVGQLESETPTGHATLSSGSAPRHDGLIGFEWRDPITKQEVLDGWSSQAIQGTIEHDLREAGAGSIPLAIKAADPHRQIVTISSEKPYAAAAMGGWAADYILYHRRDATNKNVLVPSAISGHVPPPDFFAHPNLKGHLPSYHFTDWDYLSSMLAVTAAGMFRPQALMVNFPGPDVYGHPYGGPASPRTMGQIVAGIDRNIARIVQTYKSAGIFNDTLFVITADHGMVPNDRTVAGPTTKAAVQKAGGQYLFHTGGTAADIYLKNPARARDVATQMTKVPGVAAGYYQVASGGGYQYLPVTGQQVDPALDAAYQYLLGTFAGPTAPDVVAPFRENTIGTASNYAHGDHGGLNWGAQHIPLILSGPGVRAGVTSHAPVRLMDVAPTVLRLLDLPYVNMDGTVVPDALVSPTAQETAAWAQIAPHLTAYQDAIIGQSKTDIAEDARLGVKPPPAQAARP